MPGALPEIVLLPGFMGVHLANAAGERIWLSPLAMLEGNVAEKLTLDETGEQAAPPAQSATPQVLIEAIYAEGVKRWVNEGLVVHEFPFDFRKSLLSLGLSLRSFIEARVQRSPETRFVLVGHSMGALVAAVYAYYDPAFAERIERTIFLGGPLAGTFDAVESVLGSHWMLPRIAGFTRADDAYQMQRAMLTWPGLYSMLPDPAMPLFAEAERLFSAAAWPSGLKPLQKWLDEAKAMKEVIRTSPLYRKPTTQLLSVKYRTVREIVVGKGGVFSAGQRVAKGDGAVVARTALPPGVTGYQVDFPHSLLPLDPKVITAVLDLVRTGTATLEPIEPADVEGEFKGRETPIAEMLEGVLESVVKELFSRI